MIMIALQYARAVKVDFREDCSGDFSTIHKLLDAIVYLTMDWHTLARALSKFEMLFIYQVGIDVNR